MKYPLSSDTWDQKEIAALHRVIASGRYTMGPEVKKYEQQFAEYFGTKHAVMTNSGSSANLIMLATLKLHPKFKKNIDHPNIIVPTVSWSTTFFPVTQYGYILKFVDVDPYTFNLSADTVEAAIDKNTVAVLAVNLLGNPCELAKMKSVCDDKGIVLLEDNCESLGAIENNKFAGTWGTMGTFSFFFSHHLQTMEGGMVVTNDDDLVDHLRSIRAHGWVRDIEPNSALYTKTGDPFEDSFKFVLPGYCVRPLEMSGAVGQEQLIKWPSMFTQRRANAEHAQKVFENTAGIRIQKENDTSSWFGFGFVLEGHLRGRRKQVTDILIKNQVECRPIVAGNFLRNPVIKHLSYINTGTTAADLLHDNGFFIGNDCVDLTTEINYAAELIKDIK
jgi:CDP-6-deoxy-D-xylo-4-hexulose-3-dehydrase